MEYGEDQDQDLGKWHCRQGIQDQAWCSAEGSTVPKGGAGGDGPLGLGIWSGAATLKPHGAS